MTKIIIASVIFFITALIISLISMKVPWFCRRSIKDWEDKTPAQRFCKMFLISLAGFLIAIFLLILDMQ